MNVCSRYLPILVEFAGLGGSERLDSGLEWGFLNGSFDDGFRHLATFTALGRDTKLPANISKRAGSASDGFLDLTISDSFAKAYVHGGDLINGGD